MSLSLVKEYEYRFYGGGNIAQAFIEGLLRSGYEKNKIFYVDRNQEIKKY